MFCRHGLSSSGLPGHVWQQRRLVCSSPKSMSMCMRTGVYTCMCIETCLNMCTDVSNDVSCILMACIFMAHIVVVVMTYGTRNDTTSTSTSQQGQTADIVIAYMAMANGFMACIVMAELAMASMIYGTWNDAVSAATSQRGQTS